MKKIIPSEAHKIIFPVFFIVLAYVFVYEFSLSERPASSEAAFKLGVITSKVSYSILAACIFYFISIYLPVYLPKQKRKRKILFNVFQKTLIIQSFVGSLKLNLGIQGDEFEKHEQFRKLLESINPDKPVDRFESWFSYLYHLRTRLTDIIRSMTIYNDYLSEPFLHELVIMEERLLSPHAFEDARTLGSYGLDYAQIALQEILVHTKILEELRTEEFKKYEKRFEKDGAVYRKKYYSEIDGTVS